jgi:hypothetical protein
MSPTPSWTPGPWFSSRVNLRWKISRPRRIARNGSRLIRKEADEGVFQSPRPVPISSVRDLAMPSWAAFGAWVWSINWARTGPSQRPIAASHTVAIPVRRGRPRMASSVTLVTSSTEEIGNRREKTTVGATRIAQPG